MYTSAQHNAVTSTQLLPYMGNSKQNWTKLKNRKFNVISKLHVSQPQMWYQINTSEKIFHLSGVLIRYNSVQGAFR